MVSLVGLVIDFAERGNPGDCHQLGLVVQTGSILPQLRHRIVRRAMDLDATHILFIDSDQSFPPHTLRQLLSHRLPVVGCNIATKVIPPTTTARYKSDVSRAGVPVPPSSEGGVEKVWRLGMGLMLVEMDVFRRVEPPWFQVIYRPEVDDYEGEDWFFCSRLEEHGIGIYVDNDLSLEVGHWGELKYGLDLVVLQGVENNIISVPRKKLFKPSEVLSYAEGA